MNATLYSNQMGFAHRPFAGTASFNGQDTDQALVATARMGDSQAFETLVKRYRPRIFALALRYTRVREDAEDVVQQTFQKMFLHLSNFAGRSSFSTWLTAIVINEALMHLRRARALRETSIEDLNPDEGTRIYFNLPDASLDPEAACMQREEAQILSIAITRLSPGTRTVVEMKELRELSARETARRMGVSLGTVKARLFHGRRKLRKLVAEVATSGKCDGSLQPS